MTILHPAFTILFAIMIMFSFNEVYRDQPKKSALAIWIIAILMIILSGLRGNVGADYPVYRSMYAIYFPSLDFSQVVDKMLFRHSNLDIEWMYVMLNKLVFMFGGANIWLGMLLVMLTFIYVNALDNSTARVNYKQMLRFCLWVALPIAFVNLVLTMFGVL